MAFLVQVQGGNYRLVPNLSEALSLARQVAKKTRGTSAIRAADVSAGDTLYYAFPDGHIEREGPRLKAFWE